MVCLQSSILIFLRKSRFMPCEIGPYDRILDFGKTHFILERVFSVNLVELPGVNPSLAPITFIKQINSPTIYYVYCDLIDKRQNLLNGKPSTALARFDIRSKPFEKVHYQTPQPHVLRDTESGDYDVNSITLSVQDENGNLFNFNGMPLEFEVEIN